MAITVPPGTTTATIRSVWTSRDEAALQELLDRKHNIMMEHRDRLNTVVNMLVLGGPVTDNTIDNFIAVAEALRDALLPFDGRDRA